MKYRKKPVIIDAYKYMSTEFEDAPQWFRDAVWAFIIYITDDGTFVKTLNGPVQVSPGEYIVRGVRGELYPCDPDIFHATYEEAT